MTTPKINLTQLRDEAENQSSIILERYEALALIDTAEAALAIDLTDVRCGYAWWESETSTTADYEAIDHLEQTLTHFDFTPPT